MEDLEETEIRKLAKNLKLADGSFVHYNIKSTPQIRMKSMLQQWLDHSKNPTWAEFTHAMDKIGELQNITDVCENYSIKPCMKHSLAWIAMVTFEVSQEYISSSRM